MDLYVLNEMTQQRNLLIIGVQETESNIFYRSRTGIGFYFSVKIGVKVGLTDFLRHLNRCRENELKSCLWT